MGELDQYEVPASDLTQYEVKGAAAAPKAPLQPEQPPALSRLGSNFLSALGVTSDEGAKQFFKHPIDTLMQQVGAQGELAKEAKAAYERGDYKEAVRHGLNYLIPMMGPSIDKAGTQLNQGDYAGGIGTTLGVGAQVAAASPEVRAIPGKAVDLAGEAAAKVGKITPKQAAQGVGATSGAISGHGTLSAPGAYYGGKFAGKAVEAVLGKERANQPIFGKPEPIVEPPSPTSPEGIRAWWESRGGGVADQPIDRRTMQGGPQIGQKQALLRQAEALKEPTKTVVDSVIPPSNKALNLKVNAEVDFHLQRGDVAAAEAAVDKAAKKINPSWQPERPRIVPSVQNIRENDAMVKAAEAQPGPRAADAMEDRALQQEMNWNLRRHGKAAESEARRQFIARNSTGVTKGDLAKAFNAAQGKTAPAPDVQDLTEILRKSLAQIKAQKQ